MSMPTVEHGGEADIRSSCGAGRPGHSVDVSPASGCTGFFRRREALRVACFQGGEWDLYVRQATQTGFTFKQVPPDADGLGFAEVAHGETLDVGLMNVCGHFTGVVSLPPETSQGF